LPRPKASTVSSGTMMPTLLPPAAQSDHAPEGLYSA
jgi:hypothetical protein